MKRVEVLLSHYNGKMYLEEQVDSILRQKGVDVHLTIRDDGSTEEGKEHLNRFREKAEIHYGNNVGVGNSFMEMLYKAPSADYYAFSDQDDIWKEEKLLEAIKLLERSGKQLYVSNQECINAQGESLGLRFDKKPDLSVLSILNSNPVSGCTMVMTRELKDKLTENKPNPALLKNRIHDVWVDMAAAITDDIVYDPRAFILYRQHENNVVGVKEQTKLEKLKMQMGKLTNKGKRNGRSWLAQETMRCFPEAENYEVLQKSAVYDKEYLTEHAEEFCKYSKESKKAFLTKVYLGLF